MRTKNSFLLKLLFVLFFLSCSTSEKGVNIEHTNTRNGLRYEVNSDKPYSGIVYKLQDNEGGKLGEAIQKIADKDYKPGYQFYYTYEDGKMNGRFKEFYSSGQLKVEGLYSDTVKTGLWKTFYANGQLRREASFKNNVLDGTVTEYYESGALWSKTIYRNGDLWEILSDNLSNGVASGSNVKEGNGIVFIQNAQGVNVSKVTYQNGKKIAVEPIN